LSTRSKRHKLSKTEKQQLIENQSQDDAAAPTPATPVKMIKYDQEGGDSYILVVDDEKENADNE